jgi:predicted deacylase
MANQGLRVGNLAAAPGEKAMGVQQTMISGHQVNIPVFLINGKQAGPTLAVTGGIHGAEYASIEAALQLGRSLEPDNLRGRVIVAPVVNMPAFKARSIYICPLDGINLNRVFPGKSDGGVTEQLAAWVYQNVFKQAEYYVDLHGGDLNEALVPFTLIPRCGNQAVDSRSLELAKVFGIRYQVVDVLRGSTCQAAAEAGIPAILTESGGQGIWRPEHVAAHTTGLNRLLRHLGMLDGPPLEPMPFQIMQQFVWLRSEHDGYYYPKVQVAEMVSAGQDLGYVADFQGNVLQAIAAPVAGAVLFLVSSLAMNKGDPLLAIGA